jgi:hypothetical protein
LKNSTLAANVQWCPTAVAKCGPQFAAEAQGRSWHTAPFAAQSGGLSVPEGKAVGFLRCQLARSFVSPLAESCGAAIRCSAALDLTGDGLRRATGTPSDEPVTQDEAMAATARVNARPTSSDRKLGFHPIAAVGRMRSTIRPRRLRRANGGRKNITVMRNWLVIFGSLATAQ